MDENVMTQQLLPIKNKRAAFFLTLSLLSISMGASAFSAPTWWKEKTWRPVMTLGAGASFSSQVGKTQYFPIQNPATDQFYSYVANRRSQTSFLFDGFLGAEWAVTKSNWLFQAGLEYKQASPFNARGVLTQGSASSLQNSYGYRYNVFSRQLLIEGKALYTIKNRLIELMATERMFQHQLTLPFIQITRRTLLAVQSVSVLILILRSTCGQGWDTVFQIWDSGLI
jgi:hypothetical protein